MKKLILVGFGFLASAMSVILIGSISVANAQEEVTPIDEVVVTGSRIRRNPLDEKLPITNITEQDIKRSGVSSVGDLLQRLPTSGSPVTTRFNRSGNDGLPADGSGVSAGAAEVDLRNLGTKRTLVLVDGVRWVNGSSASGVPGATDLNTIPIGIIERIEVLEDGASSIYGSDAIAGVVNVITKRDFEGVQFNVYSGGYDKGGDTTQMNISMGANDGKLSTFLDIGYTEQKAMYARDFPISATVIPFTPGVGGSSGTPQGRIVFQDPRTQIDTDADPNTPGFQSGGGLVPITLSCTTDPGSSTTPTYSTSNPCGFQNQDPSTGVLNFTPGSDSYHRFTDADRFNYSQFNLMLTPSKRTSIFGQSNYKITDNITFFTRALFNNRRSTNQAAPEPIFIGPDAGNGNLADTIGIHATNPYNPFGIDLNAGDYPGDVNFIFAGRRPLEGGPRIYNQNVSTAYVGSGFSGDFNAADRNFYWDVNMIWSRNRADQIKKGGYNSRKLKLALGPLADCQADPLCVPMNFFGGQGPNGGGSITKDMLDYISFIQKDVSEQTLTDISANISGDIVELPGGMLGFALGFETRDQQGFFQPDSTVVAGDSTGIPAQPTEGGFQADEYYVEFNAPLLSDMPGIELLSISAASRTSDYSNFGSHTTTKVGLNYKPFEDLLFRASTSEGFRAPSIGELFAGKSRNDQSLTDPCQGVDGTDAAAVQTYCSSFGIPIDGSFAQLNSQLSVLVSGDSTLQPETSESTMYGIVYSASWVDNIDFIDGLTVELTQYEHDLTNAIQPRDSQFVLDNCASTGNLCNFITRTATGQIGRIDNTLGNIGSILTSGTDFNISITTAMFDIGQFRFTWNQTFLDEYIETIPSPTGNLVLTRQGTTNGDPERSWPDMKSTMMFDWLKGEWTASLIFRNIDSVVETCPELADQAAFPTVYALCPDGTSRTIPSTTYADLQATYRPSSFDDSLDLSFGIQNMLDEDPPTCYSCALNGFDASNYDVPGKFVYFRAGYSF